MNLIEKSTVSQIVHSDQRQCKCPRYRKIFQNRVPFYLKTNVRLYTSNSSTVHYSPFFKTTVGQSLPPPPQLLPSVLATIATDAVGAMRVGRSVRGRPSRRGRACASLSAPRPNRRRAPERPPARVGRRSRVDSTPRRH